MHAFEFHDLGQARDVMLQELEFDIDRHRIYRGTRLTDDGFEAWPSMLANAIRDGDEQSLAVSLGAVGGPYIQAKEPNPKTPGVLKDVPRNAAEVLAQGEFNRYYMRALCLIAIGSERQIEVCRARFSQNPDPVSEERIGDRPTPEELLDDLRESIGIEPFLGIPRPNSGISIRLV